MASFSLLNGTLSQKFLKISIPYLIVLSIIKLSLIFITIWLFPRYLNQFIKFLNPLADVDQQLEISSGWALVLALFGIQLVQVVLESLFESFNDLVGQQLTLSVQAFAFRQVLHLSPDSLALFDDGKVFFWIKK